MISMTQTSSGCQILVSRGAGGGEGGGEGIAIGEIGGGGAVTLWQHGYRSLLVVTVRIAGEKGGNVCQYIKEGNTVSR